jgi:hypothetical protein
MNGIPVTRQILHMAPALAGSGFADDVIIASAQQARCRYIATHDAAGFRHSAIPALDPPAIVAWLTSSPSGAFAPHFTRGPRKPYNMQQSLHICYIHGHRDMRLAAEAKGAGTL